MEVAPTETTAADGPSSPGEGDARAPGHPKQVKKNTTEERRAGTRRARASSKTRRSKTIGFFFGFLKQV
jgi:hypothetical protein